MRIQVREFFENKTNSLFVNPANEPEHYYQFAEEHRGEILTARQIFDIRVKLSQDGFVLITTDLENYAPATPNSLRTDYDGPYYGEAMLALIGQIVGTIQSLPHQNDGRAFHDIMPIEADRTKQTSGSSDVTLELHTELAFVDNPPEFLMLFCVRQDHQRVAETHLHDSAFVLDALKTQQYDTLTQKRYRFGLDANITADVEVDEPLFSIFDGSTSRLTRYDIDLYKPSGDACDEAFEALTRALLDTRTAIRLRQGQLVVIDNKRIVHSRSSFTAKYDGNDRWLKRSLVRGK